MSNSIRKCRFVNCPHGGEIDIEKDEYVVEGKGMYYHPDCLNEKRRGKWKTAQVKADIQYIRTQWAMLIDRNVNYSQLLKILNDFVARGTPSEYLVFCFDYVIKNKCKLHYPLGFKYYVNDKRIIEAYKKSKIKKVENEKFKINPVDENPQKVEPSPLIAKKPQGFGSILKNKRGD